MVRLRIQQKSQGNGWQQTSGIALLASKLTSYGHPTPWTSIPWTFFLWGHLKDIVYRECPQTVQELKDLIVDSIQMIDQDKALCRRVIGHFQRRLNVCEERGGRHLEHVL